jgi:hypothetical protein
MRLSFLSVVWGRGISGSGCWGVCGFLGGIVGISVHDLDADLLGEGKLDSLAGGGSKSSDAFLDGDTGILDLWDGDAFVLDEVSAGNSGEEDGFVDTGLDGLGVRDGDLGLDNGDNGDVVAGLLGDLLAVVVAISVSGISRSLAVVSVSVSVLGGLADSHHLGLALLHERNLDGLGGGDLLLGLVRVGADLVIDLFNGLSADGSGDIIALLLVYDDLDGKINWGTGGDNGGCAHLGGLNNINYGAVVLGVLISI